MKAILLKENFQKAVIQANKIISQKPQLPILSTILLEAKKTEIIINATNLELSLIIQIPGKIEEEGKICLPAKTLQEIVYSLPPENITITQKQDLFNLICGKNKISINAIKPDEYPTLPQPSQNSKKWQIKTTDWQKLCQQVVFSASTDETRPVLTGIKIISDENKLLAVATDGYRLSQKKLKGKYELKGEIIIPAKALSELSRIIHEEEIIIIDVDKKQNQVIFQCGQSKLISRLLEGEFPEFSKIIPSATLIEAVVDREGFNQALKIASVFARESANIIKLKIEKSKCKISANAPQVGQNETELDVQFKGEELEIAFNYRFVQDFLNSIEEDQIVMKFNGPLSPVIFQPVKDDSYLHIIMPVRLQQATE